MEYATGHHSAYVHNKCQKRIVVGHMCQCAVRTCVYAHATLLCHPQCSTAHPHRTGRRACPSMHTGRKQKPSKPLLAISQLPVSRTEKNAEGRKWPEFSLGGGGGAGAALSLGTKASESNAFSYIRRRSWNIHMCKCFSSSSATRAFDSVLSLARYAVFSSSLQAVRAAGISDGSASELEAAAEPDRRLGSSRIAGRVSRSLRHPAWCSGALPSEHAIYHHADLCRNQHCKLSANLCAFYRAPNPDSDKVQQVPLPRHAL